MSLTHEQVVQTMTKMLCRSNFNIKNVTEFMLPELKEAVYLHQEAKTPLLIIRPAFEVFSGELATLNGVHDSEDAFHQFGIGGFL